MSSNRSGGIIKTTSNILFPMGYKSTLSLYTWRGTLKQILTLLVSKSESCTQMHRLYIVDSSINVRLGNRLL